MTTILLVLHSHLLQTLTLRGWLESALAHTHDQYTMNLRSQINIAPILKMTTFTARCLQASLYIIQNCYLKLLPPNRKSYRIFINSCFEILILFNMCGEPVSAFWRLNTTLLASGYRAVTKDLCLPSRKTLKWCLRLTLKALKLVSAQDFCQGLSDVWF